MTATQKSDACVLFAEITGDAPLLDKIGAMETQRAVERCRNRAERAIDAYQGTIVEAAGRTLIAHFPRTESAALAAFDLRERVSQLPPVSGVRLSLHAILHHGRLDGGIMPSETVMARAKALVGATPTGKIVLSPEAATSMPAHIQSQLETLQLEGVEGALFTLDAIQPGASPVVPASTAPGAAPEPQGTGAEAPPPVADEPTARPVARQTMMLSHNRATMILSEARPIVLAGREEGNDIVIGDRRASRHHARIEWRHGSYMLIDTSTNGTYMTDDAGLEVALRHAEAEMPSRGRIGFGYSPSDASAEVVIFDIAQR